MNHRQDHQIDVYISSVSMDRITLKWCFFKISTNLMPQLVRLNGGQLYIKYGNSGEKLPDNRNVDPIYVDFFKNVKSQWVFKWAHTRFLLESNLPEMKFSVPALASYCLRHSFHLCFSIHRCQIPIGHTNMFSCCSYTYIPLCNLLQ